MSPAAQPAPSRREDRTAESRRRILDAAEELMAERGFAGTSIAAVIERSGLPASSIYWHFGSKQQLLAAVIEDSTERWFAEVPSLDDLEGTPTERGLEMLEIIAEGLEARPEFLRLTQLIALERREIDGESLRVIRRVRARGRAGLRRALRVLLDPAEGKLSRRVADELASLALAAVDGIFLQNQIEPRATNVGKQISLLRDALVGLGRERMKAAGRRRRPARRKGR